MKRARPSPQLLRAQRESKQLWRQQVSKLPFEEKIALVVEMQRRLYPILQERGRLRPWEQPALSAIEFDFIGVFAVSPADLH